MKCLRTIAVLLFPAISAACSFNYTALDAGTSQPPDMVFMDVSVDRYENSRLSVQVTAALLELYDRDRVWAAETVGFTSYSILHEVDAAGSAGILMLDDRTSIYMLGNGTYFYVADDDISVHSEALRWSKPSNQLQGPLEDEVVLVKGDGTTLKGRGFRADTLAQEYVFETMVSGVIVSGSTVGSNE